MSKNQTPPFWLILDGANTNTPSAIKESALKNRPIPVTPMFAAEGSARQLRQCGSRYFTISKAWMNFMIWGVPVAGKISTASASSLVKWYSGLTP